MRHRTTTLSIALAAIVFSAAGCGSDAKTAGTVASTTAATTATTAAPAATTATTVATTAATAAPTTDAAPSTEPASTSASTPAGSAPTVQLVQSTLGTILADAEGATLYVFTKDSGGTSVCAGGCATAWPPLAAPATPGTGLDAEDFATITRADGTEQVTFYGHPLYTFAGDAKPGDVSGQGSNGVWYVVGADGTPIETAAAIPGY